MMQLWKSENWKKYCDNRESLTGLLLKFDKDVNFEVKEICKSLCKWLRNEYYFPVQLRIYIKSNYRVRADYGELVCGIFLPPDERWRNPRIRIATGDFEEIVRDEDEDTAEEELIYSICYQITFYFQWLNHVQLTEIGQKRQASYYAFSALDEYFDSKS